MRRISPKLAPLTFALAMVAAAVTFTAVKAMSGPQDEFQVIEQNGHLRVVRTGPVRLARLYSSNQFVSVPSEVIWRQICGSRSGSLDAATLLTIAQEEAAAYQTFSIGAPIDSGVFPSRALGGGLNLVMSLTETVPVEAQPAIAAVESYLESRFADPITVRISIRYRPLSPGTLGSTSIVFLAATWNTSRAGLQNGMDANDVVQNYLPSGSLLKVRYNGSSGTMTNENRVFWTHANFKSTVGSMSGLSGTVAINSGITWDYDPSDGIDPGATSFQDVLVHEVGHILGFSSGVDGRTSDLETLDLLRFQFTDGSGDFNPDNAAEFTVRPRLVDFNNPNDNAVTDIVLGEYRMSDGDPWQASHFREQSPRIGLMDPALAEGETYYPAFFSVADLRVFDAIGWDR